MLIIGKEGIIHAIGKDIQTFFRISSIKLVVLLGIFYRLLWIFQGVDTVDIGFCNVFYDTIFDRPETNTFNFIYYLTGLVGGVWEKYLGFTGLLGFRCLEVFTLTLAICLTYKSCRDFIDERDRWIALAISFLFPLIVVTFHYDTFSSVPSKRQKI